MQASETLDRCRRELYKLGEGPLRVKLALVHSDLRNQHQKQLEMNRVAGTLLKRMTGFRHSAEMETKRGGSLLLVIVTEVVAVRFISVVTTS